MKSDPWRREPASYALQGELQPRYIDLDLWRHLNNTALVSMHVENTQRWLRETLGAQVWRQTTPLWGARALATDFLAEGQYPETVHTGVRLLGVERSALHLGSALFQAGRCIGLQDVWLAPWHDGQAQPLDDALLAQLRARLDQQPPLPAGVAAPMDGAAALPVRGAPPLRGTLPRAIELGARFSDSDAQGWTSDVCLGRCIEESRVRFLRALLSSRSRESGMGFMVGHVAMRWLHRARPPAQWSAEIGVSRVGERSYALRTALYDTTDPQHPDRCVALGESVMVVIDHAERRSRPMPDEFRTLLQPFVIAG